MEPFPQNCPDCGLWGCSQSCPGPDSWDTCGKCGGSAPVRAGVLECDECAPSADGYFSREYV